MQFAVVYLECRGNGARDFGYGNDDGHHGRVPVLFALKIIAGSLLESCRGIELGNAFLTATLEASGLYTLEGLNFIDSVCAEHGRGHKTTGQLQ